MVLEDYRSTKNELKRVPLKPRKDITNENTETILIDRLNPFEVISHVFELPSIGKNELYMHAAAGPPTKEMWVRAIRTGITPHGAVSA